MVVQIIHVYINQPVNLSLMLIRHQLIDVIVELVILVEIVKLVRIQKNFILQILTYYFTFKKKAVMIGSCERIPCVHGQCFKTNAHKEICVCKDNWNGIDCSQKSYPIKIQTSTKSMKNLTNNDLNAYLHWLNTNYGISKIPNRLQPLFTTPVMAHRFSINKNFRKRNF